MAGTWQALDHQPWFCASTMLLLTDGSVMCQQENGRQWWKLTPDRSGTYVGGTWSKLASMRLARMYFASAVLPDGRVFVAGGEYNGSNAAVDLAAAEMYDPLTDMWSDLPTPAGWTEIGDASACMLADGRILVGRLSDRETAFFTPGPDTWAPGPNKSSRSNEESWALLADGTVLAVETLNAPQAEKYVPATNTWVSAGATPASLVDAPSSEIGPEVVLTDGRCFAIGATGMTALYTPPATATDPGTWAAGPSFPSSNGNPLGAKDAPACLLPNGRVLCAVAPVNATPLDYLTPTSFFEFDGTSLVRAPDPPNAGGAPYSGMLLIVPSGQALFSAQSPEIYAYTPDAAPMDEWRPSITECPESVQAGASFTLHGQQLNGLSQASMYGDDATVATNYPIVRLTTSTGRVVFCRTSGHSTMAIATGSTPVSTTVGVPADVDDGPADLVVVANGIASAPCHTVVVGGRAAAKGETSRTSSSSPMAAPAKTSAKRGIFGTIGLGVRYVGCGFFFVCNWAAQLTCAQTETTGYQQCTQTRDDGYNKCTQTRDDGYNKCTQSRDDGYNQCCTWWPCSWFCDAWVWISNVVCVAWTWISNVVCVAWTWISNVVCVAWTWIVATSCKAFTWVMRLVCA